MAGTTARRAVVIALERAWHCLRLRRRIERRCNRTSASARAPMPKTLACCSLDLRSPCFQARRSRQSCHIDGLVARESEPGPRGPFDFASYRAAPPADFDLGTHGHRSGAPRHQARGRYIRYCDFQQFVAIHQVGVKDGRFARSSGSEPGHRVYRTDLGIAVSGPSSGRRAVRMMSRDCPPASSLGPMLATWKLRPRRQRRCICPRPRTEIASVKPAMRWLR
jgi:hypothetical protein